MSGFEDALQRMRRELLDRHNTAVAADDALLLAMTASLFIVEESLRSAKEHHSELLRHHRAEIEALLGQWEHSAEQAADLVAQRTQTSNVTAADEHVEAAFKAASKRIEAALRRHQDLMRAHTWASTVAVAVAAVAAAISILNH